MTDQTFPQQQYTSIETEELNRLRARLLETQAVVVPEPTSDEWRAIAENARSADMVDFLAGAAAYGLWLRLRGKIRAIPADRVLGDGEIKGTPEELAKIAEEAGWKWIRTPIESKKTLVDWMADALRANQGGAAT